MENSLFFNHINITETNKKIIRDIEEYANSHPDFQVYLVSAPLGEDKDEYDYSENCIVLLSPKHKIIFFDLKDEPDSFDEFYEDFMEDINSISRKYNYQKYIKRARKWKGEFTTQIKIDKAFDIKETLQNNLLPTDKHRKVELIISLAIGSINDIEKIGAEQPKTTLEKVKNNIILFDGEQTRFIYKKTPEKKISIQGLSGTGKTELLMHKLKEIYSTEDNPKIFFTCHNIALSNTLKERIPVFFDFMKVEKQIKWNSNLWVDRAWGSRGDKNSGLYSYICDFYNLSFSRWSNNTSYTDIFTKALSEINEIEDFNHAFDYIIIDERQDFPSIFFDLCEKIAKKKVYIAGDIFQDIFENNIKKEVDNVDYVLNKCYRTAPKILMFAHSIGMGLFEKNKLNWLEDKEWEASGYHLERANEKILLSRESIRRFEGIEEDASMNILQYTGSNQTIEIIKNIIRTNPTVNADDIAIIMLDRENSIYSHMDNLEYLIKTELGWKVNKAHETKQKKNDQLFMSNINNVKGLEFPFVICITRKIKNTYAYRNSLYTMLTRSFLQSYLMIKEFDGVEVQIKGLESINKNNVIESIEPTAVEKEAISRKIIKIKNISSMSFYDFINKILTEEGIDRKYWKNFIRALPDDLRSDFDKKKIVEFINVNRKYFCK